MDEKQTTKIAITSSFNLDMIPRVLENELKQYGINPTFFLTGFDQYRQALLDPSSQLYIFEPDFAILFVDFQDLFQDICNEPCNFSATTKTERVEKGVELFSDLVSFFLRKLTGSSIFVCNMAYMPFGEVGILEYNAPASVKMMVDLFNFTLSEALCNQSRVYIIDIKSLYEKHGYWNLFDSRMWTLGRMRFGSNGLLHLGRFCSRYIKSALGIGKKNLVLDLDNTLWGGVVGQDGINGIKLGRDGVGFAYFQFQLELLKLYKRGVILSINSKNNVKDVEEVFDKHPDMVLRREHFSAMMINWQDKASNMRQISKLLNINMNSFVFVDDNQVELEWVCSQIPEIEMARVPDDPAGLVQMVKEWDYFDSITITNEDATRGEMYRQRAEVENSRKKFLSLEEFLKSLEMKLTVFKPNNLTIPRITQLTQKTNQFNLTSRRYTEAAISDMLNKPNWEVYGVSLSDKFGDNGIVGVSITEKQYTTCRIDTFLLSCRVIGRGVENAFLAFLYKKCLDSKIEILQGEFIPTKKNDLVKDFYKSNSFLNTDGLKNMIWELNVAVSKLSIPEYFDVQVKED